MSQTQSKSPPVSPSGKKLFYGWWILFASFLIYLLTMGPRSSFGNMIDPWIKEFNWNLEQVSFAASMGLIVYGIFQPVSGWMVNRFGPRKVILWGLLIYGLSSTVTALISSLWQLYLLYGLITALSWSACTTISLSALISSWFHKRRGLALSVAQSGMAMGQFLLVPFSMFLIINRDWRFALGLLSALILLIALPLAWKFVRDTPGEMGLLPDGDKDKGHPSGDNPAQAAKAAGTALPKSQGLKEAMTTPSFWLLVGSYFVCGMTAHLLSVHFVPSAINLGYPPLTAATAGGLVGGSSIFGIWISGFISDKIGRKIPLASLYLLRGVGVLMLVYSFNEPSLYISAMMIGFGTLGTASLTAGAVADIYGVASMGTILGFVSMGHQVAGGISVYLGGMLAQEHGNYHWVFLPAVFFLFAAFVACLFIKEKRPQRQPSLSPPG